MAVNKNLAQLSLGIDAGSLVARLSMRAAQDPDAIGSDNSYKVDIGYDRFHLNRA